MGFARDVADRIVILGEGEEHLTARYFPEKARVGLLS